MLVRRREVSRILAQFILQHCSDLGGVLFVKMTDTFTERLLWIRSCYGTLQTHAVLTVAL